MVELINEHLVNLDVDLETSDQAIETIVQMLSSDNRLIDSEQYKKDVYLREKEISTAIGMDIAIPHARSKGVKIPSLTLLRLNNPVKWNQDFVKLIIGIAVPEGNEQGTDYLKILSKLARKLMADEFREALMNANSSNSCVQLLHEI